LKHAPPRSAGLAGRLSMQAIHSHQAALTKRPAGAIASRLNSLINQTLDRVGL
jgi:hypothetical protein